MALESTENKLCIARNTLKTIDLQGYQNKLRRISVHPPIVEKVPFFISLSLLDRNENLLYTNEGLENSFPDPEDSSLSYSRKNRYYLYCQVFLSHHLFPCLLHWRWVRSPPHIIMLWGDRIEVFLLTCVTPIGLCLLCALSFFHTRSSQYLTLNNFDNSLRSFWYFPPPYLQFIPCAFPPYWDPKLYWAEVSEAWTESKMKFEPGMSETDEDTPFAASCNVHRIFLRNDFCSFAWCVRVRYWSWRKWSWW